MKAIRVHRYGGPEVMEQEDVSTPGPGEGQALVRIEAAGVPCDGELVVRRVVMAEGRSRAYLNGRLGTVGLGLDDRR